MEECILTKEEAECRGQLISNVEYQVLIVLSEGKHFFGALTSSFCLADEEEMWFDYSGKSVLGVTINGVLQEVRYKLGRIFLNNLKKGENTVSVTFESTYSHDGLGLHQLTDPVDKETYLYSQFEPFAANRVFPCFDQPDLKSVFEFSIVAKENWEVISNTSLKSPPFQIAGSGTLSDVIFREDFNNAVFKEQFPFEPAINLLSNHLLGGYKVHHFSKTDKISTYLAALCAGPYFRAEVSYKYPLGFYCRQSMKLHMDVELYKKWTIAGFEFYEEFFDYPYPFKKYDQVFVPEFNFIAMENVACVTLDDKFLFANGLSQNRLIRACIIMLHEMSHMWFGNLVTMKWWDDLWLNESFATYISVLCVDRALHSTFPQAWIWFYAKIRTALSLDQQSTTHPISCDIKNSIEIFSFFDSITYEKGSTVLKQLVYLIGEDQFKAALRGYFKHNAFGNATFASLINEIAGQANEIDIHEWAQKWIKTAGLNEMVAEIIRNDQDSILSYKIEQKGAVVGLDTIRLHCFTVAVLNKDFEVVYTKKLQGERFEEKLNEVNGEILVFDIGHHDFIKPVLDELSLKYLLKNISQLQDPLTRMQIYGLALDLTTDRKLNVHQLFEFFLSNLSTEVELFNTIFIVKGLNQIFQMIFHEKEVIENTSQEIVKILLNKKETADEMEKQTINKLIIKVLNHPSDILQAVAWLDTENLKPSIRWGILKKYSALTISAKPLVESELKSNHNHSSLLHYHYCSAAYPVESEKLLIWRKLINKGQSLPKFERIQLMKGFNQMHQKDLLKTFAYSYFHQVLSIVNKSDLNFSVDFLTYLLPMHLNLNELKPHIALLITELPFGRKDLIIKLEQALDSLDSLITLN